MAVKYCGDSFCMPEKGSIDSACHDLGKQAGKEIMYQRPGGTCYCICSCLGDGTDITLSDGKDISVQQIVPDQTRILAAGLDLAFKSYVVKQKSLAPPAETLNTLYVTYSLNGKSITLVVTASHPFLLYGTPPRIVGAGKLQPQDLLVDRNGKAVSIDKIDWGSYNSSFWEIATVMEVPDANLSGHLVVAGGVVTGDFAVETYVNYPLGTPTPLGNTLIRDRPVVGSREWIAAHGKSSGTVPVMVKGHKFTPASLHAVKVPAHASDFLPRWQAEWFERVAPKRPYNDAYALELCEWLLDRVFRPLYKDVEFLFDWYSDEVNTHSWVDGKKKYVYLSGGLSRVEAMDYDGVALALAHEVGHLYGKPDHAVGGVVPGVTCEGEADFFGAAIVLRNIWFGEFYFSGTQRAIDQVKALYAYLKLQGSKGEHYDGAALRLDKAGRGYPSDKCRISTWEAAMSTPHKPACADCTPPKA